MRKLFLISFVFFISIIARGQNNDIPLFKDCDSLDNKLACSYFKIHQLILTTLNKLDASSIKLKQEDELIISTILSFNKEGKLRRKNSVLYSAFISAESEFEELLKLIPDVTPKLNKKGEPTWHYFRNTFYYRYVNNSFETWNNGDAKKQDFDMPERVPIYSGCKPKWSNQRLKDCMSSRISKYIQSAFNTKVISKADGILPGNSVIIYIYFKIDETGKFTNVKAKAPIKALEQEAIRLIQRLSKIEPGYQGNKPVVVPYSLPIRFNVSF